jgi:hypothetical protein
MRLFSAARSLWQVNWLPEKSSLSTARHRSLRALHQSMSQFIRILDDPQSALRSRILFYAIARSAAA